MPPDLTSNTLGCLNRYLDIFPSEQDGLAKLSEQLNSGEDCFSRGNMSGHITTSAAVVSPDMAHILLVFHRTFQQWQPPGGHYRPPGTLLASAMRETQEETGIGSLVLHPWSTFKRSPLHIATYPIAPNAAKGEGAHWHHDFCYLLVASGGRDCAPQLSEVCEAAWHPVESLPLFGEHALAAKLSQALCFGRR